jgi:hypothetical protein
VRKRKQIWRIENMGIKEKIAGLGTKTLAIIAALAVVVSAATVAYISNAVTATATVSNPFEIQYWNPVDNAWQTTTLDLGSVHGGEIISVTANLVNNANNVQKAKTSVTCTGWDSGTAAPMHDCDAFNGAATMTWDSSTCDGTTCSASIACTPTNGIAVFNTQDGTVPFNPGSNNVNTLAVTLAQGYKGTLSCVAQAFVAP